MNSCLPTEGVQAKAKPRWSDIFGGNKSPASDSGSKSPVTERPEEMLRLAPISYMGPVVFKT